MSKVFITFVKVLCAFVAFVKVQSNKTDKSCNKANNTGHLGRFKYAHNQPGIIPPQVFQKKSDQGIQHDIQGKGLTFYVRKSPKKQQYGKNDKIQLPFPDFGWPKRLTAIGMIGQS